MTGFADALQGSAFGAWASATAYPFANIAHLLGLVMLVGGIGLVDLRLAGAFRGLPPATLSRYLTPVALTGLALQAASGFVMFASDAKALILSDTFRWKLILIGLALANALLFRLLWRDRIERWDEAAPVVGRSMAVGSVLLWLAVMWQGRMIAYS